MCPYARYVASLFLFLVNALRTSQFFGHVGAFHGLNQY